MKTKLFKYIPCASSCGLCGRVRLLETNLPLWKTWKGKLPMKCCNSSYKTGCNFRKNGASPPRINKKGDPDFNTLCSPITCTGACIYSHSFLYARCILAEILGGREKLLVLVWSHTVCVDRLHWEFDVIHTVHTLTFTLSTNKCTQKIQ